MGIGRVWANLTTRATRYEAGNISTPQQLDAAKSVKKLQDTLNAVAKDMLSLDNTPADFNGDKVNNVYLDGSHGKYAGNCVKSNDKDQVLRLAATGGNETYEIKTRGDHQEIRQTKDIAGPAGESHLFEEQWAVFDGSSVKYKAISYFQ